MTELTVPTVDLYGAWLEAHVEWGAGLHEDGFGLLPTDDVDSAVGFTEWVARLGEDKQCTYRWITEHGEVLGGIALRHESHPQVAHAGHVGYGIRPSARRRGLASWAFGQMMDEARSLGMDRVLAVCEAGNITSATTIERQCGVLEGGDPGSAVWRYWIETGIGS